jgi:general stress protein 26
MTTPADIEGKFWKSLKSDMTLMLGLVGETMHSQPMTAQFDPDRFDPDRVDGGDHTIWFFTARSTDLARAMGDEHRAMAQFAAKGHDLFACIEGRLVRDTSQAMIDKLWSPYVAAWFQGGKADPDLLLLRFEPAHAQVWLNEHSLFAGVKLLLGRDPKEEYADKTAELDLRRGAAE